MKLFISWSGEFSRKVAERLSIWIPTIIQTVDVFYSPDSITKGEEWGKRLSDELEQSNFFLFCLTPENILSPWIHFEAGAFSKVSNSQVSTIMLGVSPFDVKGPLANFQNIFFNREDFHRLFLSINNSHETPLKQAVLDHAFDSSWEKLEHDIATIIKEYSFHFPAPSSEEPKRNKHRISNTAIQKILSVASSWENGLKAPSRVVPNPPPNASNVITKGVLAMVSCTYQSIDYVLSVLCNYANFSPEAISARKARLSETGSCIIMVDADLISALAEELQEVGASICIFK